MQSFPPSLLSWEQQRSLWPLIQPCAARGAWIERCLSPRPTVLLASSPMCTIAYIYICYVCIYVCKLSKILVYVDDEKTNYHLTLFTHGLEMQRMAILRTVSKQLPLGDVDLTNLAARTAGYEALLALLLLYFLFPTQRTHILSSLISFFSYPHPKHGTCWPKTITVPTPLPLHHSQTKICNLHDRGTLL